MPRPRRLPTVLTPAETTALLRAANPRYRTGHRDRCLMQLMLNAGLRAAEVLALTVYDIDWLSGKLTVRQGKGKKDRILWLNEPVLEELRRWRPRRPANAQGLLFPTLKGTPIHASALRAMVKRRGHKAGTAAQRCPPAYAAAHVCHRTLPADQGYSPGPESARAIAISRPR